MPYSVEMMKGPVGGQTPPPSEDSEAKQGLLKAADELKAAKTVKDLTAKADPVLENLEEYILDEGHNCGLPPMEWMMLNCIDEACEDDCQQGTLMKLQSLGAYSAKARGVAEAFEIFRKTFKDCGANIG